MIKMQDTVGEKTINTNKTTASAGREGLSLIVEFVGPTGSGKTTNCRHFSQLFSDNGMRVYVFKDVKQFLYQLGTTRRYAMYLSTLLYNAKSLVSYTCLLAANGIYSMESIVRFFKLCIFNGAAQAFIKSRPVDLLLLDQWIIQGLWSATILKAKEYSTLEKKLPGLYFPTHYVLFFDVDEDTACSRIKSRQGGRSRFDTMDDNTRLSLLKRYNEYLRGLFDRSRCDRKLIFSTKKDPRENAEEFLNHIKFTQVN